MRLGRFQLTAQRSAGPDGLSFEAKDTRTGRPCEVRDLSGARVRPQRWNELVRRLRAAQLLIHPCQRAVLELQLEQDPPFLALEAVPDSVLADVPCEEVPWPANQIVRLAGQMCSALSAAHRLGLVHGALKPSTVFWEPAGEI